MNRNTRPSTDRAPNRPAVRPFGHAVVIGGSLAGLSAARVLAERFERVTVIERDRLGAFDDVRSGLPQAHHAHTIQPRGQALLEGYFPGIVDELIQEGAVEVQPERDVAFYKDGRMRRLDKSASKRSQAASRSVASSRALLDALLYRRVSAMPGVEVGLRREVMGLALDAAGDRLAGVRLRSRENPSVGEEMLPADLVVDASGRGSRAPQWLQELGFEAPKDEIVNPFTGYATMLFERPHAAQPDWKVLYVRPTAPCDTRGGVVVPLDDERWMVTLVGMAGDYPPTDVGEFLSFARTLATPSLYRALENARPISGLHSYRRTENRRRHFERMQRPLEGFIVLGDAAVILNPVYALGMTAGLVGAQALETSLENQARKQADDLDGLAKDFQTRLDRVLTRLWDLATQEDRQYVDESVRSEPTGRRFALPLSAYSLCSLKAG